jgi:hypothetical protein
MGTRNNTWLILLLAAIIVCGVSLAFLAVRSEEERLRDQILTETRLAVSGLDLNQVLSLSGSEDDLTSPVYMDLKEEMVQIRSAEPLCRFAYIIGKRSDGSYFFYVDSEPPDSPDYSPPGQEYPEVTKAVLKAFSSGDLMVAGPDSDRWGTWVSGLSPLKHPDTGEVFSVFG